MLYNKNKSFFSNFILEVFIMPRPKGSKNRKPSVRRKGVANAESISEAKAAVATQIEALTSEVNEAAAALKAKKEKMGH